MSIPVWVARRKQTTAVVASSPATRPHSSEACRGTQLARRAVAVTATATQRDGLGHGGGPPAGLLRHLAHRREQQAEAGPGEDAVHQARRPGPPTPSGSRLTSQMPGTAAAMPTHTSAEGRSPVDTATTTGRSAAPTAETGATTPIRPAANPR